MQLNNKKNKQLFSFPRKFGNFRTVILNNKNNYIK